MLTQNQIRDYFEQGYLLVENVITAEQLKTLQNITSDFIEASRTVSESNDVYDLDVGHAAENPDASSGECSGVQSTCAVC